MPAYKKESGRILAYRRLSSSIVVKKAEEEAPAEDDDDKQNFPIRLNKLKQQRDSERAAREALEEQVRELKAGKRAEPEADVADPIDEINASLEAMYEQVEEYVSHCQLQ